MKWPATKTKLKDGRVIRRAVLILTAKLIRWGVNPGRSGESERVMIC